MIATPNFVYIHTSRHGGTFVNNLILNHIPDSRLIQYHGQLSNLPKHCAKLPIIGHVRNPWDFYVSLYFNYKKKKQYLFQIISENGTLDFEETISRYLTLGNQSEASKTLIDQLIDAAPKEIHPQLDPNLRNPGLTAKHFAKYPAGTGYYTWLFKLMYNSRKKHKLHIGRFENLREETMALLKTTGTPITPGILEYLNKREAMNPSEREKSYKDYYSKELQLLVAEKDRYIIERFGYTF
ncbi:hypothetical protein [Oceanicoccus sagamiensis]|uniref:Sulfotransferase domain-containing protein n=1 Tax=Oceanicoccus sagamiensis TaxID=716816 RepID=A0A1X9NL34_9GAMM|nr:hypothetical protein [Oceanicoccus sagamiensis]ARN76129.1 hypothetical protein BST96_19725 [Oceanicoccus sagamiensis]